MEWLLGSVDGWTLSFQQTCEGICKSESRARGSLMSKVVATGGIEIIRNFMRPQCNQFWMYGSGIWGTTQFSCISSVQNRACKFFLSVGKHTSNIAARGDMG